jgi:hypothetical protein
METNIQLVINSLTRQISELSVKLALAEAHIEALQSSESTEEEE